MAEAPASRRRRLTLAITGLHCRGCGSTVAGALRRETGVLEARVDGGEGRGWVVYDPASTSPEAILGSRVLQPPSPFEAAVLEDREV